LHCPDLILLDWELPGMPIEALVFALHRLCPRLVLVGLGRGGEQRQHAAHLAVDAFASKTESAEKLLALIHAAMLPGKQVTELVK
jgi:DNA-binding NarL/FixJ family response regulator